MSDKKSRMEEIESFFKTRVYIDDLAEVLAFEPSKLIGIDNVSNKSLVSSGIKNIEDLANLSDENPPNIANLLPSLVIKWIKTAKVLKRAVFEQIKQEKKLLMVGLDNGGKTSLLKIIQNKFARDLLPTRGINRETLDFFGFPIISWDLGGQLQFRETWYFEKPELYFTEANLMIYVIDIQDRGRFKESSEYFQKILDVLTTLGEKIPILIVLHKSDPDILNTAVWEKNYEEISTIFNGVLGAYDFKHDYAMTSIFQKDTVIQMFSNALKRFSDTSEIIESILEDLSVKIKAQAMSLISIEGLIFGSYSTNETLNEILVNTGMLLQTLQQFYKSKKLLPDQSIINKLTSNKISIRGDRLFEYSEQKTPVFLWTLSENVDLLDEKLDYVKQELLPLVKFFL